MTRKSDPEALPPKFRHRRRVAETHALEMWTQEQLSLLAVKLDGPSLEQVIDDLKRRGLLR